MYSYKNLRRGLDLNLEGAVEDGASSATVFAGNVAMVPDDFPGFTPKAVVRPGEKVTAGQPLLTDKNNPEIAIVSPVSGTVGDVVRGERRKILRVTVTADKDAPASAGPAQLTDNSPEAIRRAIMQSGLWVMMRQLPYAIIPDANTAPRDIFVSAIDSAPLAASLTDLVAGKGKEIRAGIKALEKLTDGKIYITVRDIETTAALWGDDAATSEKVIVTQLTGKHPAGLPSVQASLLAPVNKGDTVWLLDVDTLARIGSVMLTGRSYWTASVALTGSEIKHPHIIETTVGAALRPLVEGQTKDSGHHLRFISGNVLTGHNETADGYLRFPYRQITVIPEGDDVDEFMGWASLSPRKMSENRSFLSHLFGPKHFSPDARLNGGRRAMIMSGLYEKVMPMDIMPEHLIKAILSRDIDKMEALGIYEVTPDDFALCEYVDPSKLELQKAVREGLDYLRKELS